MMFLLHVHVMWVKQCHKQPIFLGWFMASLYPVSSCVMQVMEVHARLRPRQVVFFCRFLQVVRGAFFFKVFFLNGIYGC